MSGLGKIERSLSRCPHELISAELDSEPAAQALRATSGETPCRACAGQAGTNRRHIASTKVSDKGSQTTNRILPNQNFLRSLRNRQSPVAILMPVSITTTATTKFLPGRSLPEGPATSAHRLNAIPDPNVISSISDEK